MDTSALSFALGAVVGIILALTGAGGGILAVPLLVFGLRLGLAQAAPVGLLAVGLSAAVGALLGLKEGIVRYRAAALIGVAGMALAPLGSWLAQRTPNAPLTALFGVVMAVVSWRNFRKTLGGAPAAPVVRPPCVINPQRGRLAWTRPCAWALAGTGAVSGLLSGLLGVGGGFVIVPALSRYTDVPVRGIMATSLAVIALVSAGATATAVVHGTIAWGIAVPFAAGAVAAQLAGRQLSARLAGAHLQRAFAAVAMAVACLLVYHAAAGMLPA
ncbi:MULTISPECIES: sulfite exporter TauE/SafE family protein [Cupriavidus]